MIILQQKCLNKWIGSAPKNTILPLSTLFYTFYPRLKLATIWKIHLNDNCKWVHHQNLHIWNSRRQHTAQLFQTLPLPLFLPAIACLAHFSWLSALMEPKVCLFFCILQTSILALPLACVVLIEEEGGTFTKRSTVLTVLLSLSSGSLLSLEFYLPWTAVVVMSFWQFLLRIQFINGTLSCYPVYEMIEYILMIFCTNHYYYWAKFAGVILKHIRGLVFFLRHSKNVWTSE